MDGAIRTQVVVIVGATNHPEAIDPALLRSGRLETRVDIPLPDVGALVGILRHHLGGDADSVVASTASFRLWKTLRALAGRVPWQMNFGRRDTTGMEVRDEER